MDSKHIAFFLEQAYGHIIPTLGLATELMRRGHRVSYAVTSEFAPAIVRSGARAVVFNPIETRSQVCEYSARPDGSYDMNLEEEQFSNLWSRLRAQRTADSIRQLELLYAGDQPNLVVHDDCLDTAGRELADRWGIARVRHDPDMFSKRRMIQYVNTDDRLILVSVPKFFNLDLELFDERFRFIGFNPEGRREFFQPWRNGPLDQQIILACPTTGLLPPIKFCRLIVEAFQNSSRRVVLSVPGDLDPVSSIGAESLAHLPDNITLNRHSCNLDLLEHACLFIGSGGQGSTLEAIFSGVPALLLPTTQGHHAVAQRLVELGLGASLHISVATPESVRSIAEAVINDPAVLEQLKLRQEEMRTENGVIVGADLIEGILRSNQGLNTAENL